MKTDLLTPQPTDSHQHDLNSDATAAPFLAPTRRPIDDIQQHFKRVGEILFEQNRPVDVLILLPIERSADARDDMIVLARLSADCEDGGEEGGESHAGAEFERDGVG